MKLRWNNVNFPIYAKLVAAFLIVIAPLYAIGLNMNNSGERSVKRELYNSMQSKTHFYLHSLETEFAQTIKLMQEYSIDPDLLMLSAASEMMSDIEFTEAIVRLQSRMRVMKETSDYISAAMAFIPAIERVVTSERSIETLNETEFYTLNLLSNPHAPPFLYWDKRIFLKLGAANFVLAVEVSREELGEALLQFAAGSDGGSSLISDRKDWSVTNVEDSLLMDRLNRVIEESAVRNSSHYPNEDRAVEYGSIAVGEQQYLVTYEHSQLLGATLLTYVPEKIVLGPLEPYKYWFWLMSLTALLLIALFSFWLYRLIHSPLIHLVKAFRRVERGELEIQVHSRSRDEFRYLYGQFNSTVARLKELIDEVYEQKYRTRLAELRQLQSQINPHFLYNCFFNLYRMAKMHEIEKVIHATKHLGDYFQFVTSGSDEVQLELEMKYAIAYVEIQTIRFEDHIQVEMAPLPEHLKRLSVPKLIVQPLIENSYNHGLEDRASGGRIMIRIEERGDVLEIHIEDNGDSMDDAALESLQASLRSRLPASREDGTGTGLINVHRRLLLKYGDNGGLSVVRGQAGGLNVILRLALTGGD